MDEETITAEAKESTEYELFRFFYMKDDDQNVYVTTFAGRPPYDAEHFDDRLYNRNLPYMVYRRWPHQEWKYMKQNTKRWSVSTQINEGAPIVIAGEDNL